METIYLDNAATTPISEKVQNEMIKAEKELFYNSAALYRGSLYVKKAIKHVNDIVKQKLAGGHGELIFTSGATEGNNMVIFGKITHKRHHLIVASGEHSSVYAPSVHLKDAGYDVDYVPLLPSGEIDCVALKRLVKSNTALFVFGMVNSDTGHIQNAAEIIKTVRSVNPNVHIHCDAVQAFCKLDFNVCALRLDSVVVSAHKINGPKGIGALWLKKGVVLKPLMFGGSQQDYRPGTENNAAIIGFGAAVSGFDTDANFAYIKKLHTRLVESLPAECKINGLNQNPYITNIMLPGVLGSTVMNALSEKCIYIGLGSACAATASKNRTLLAMGIPEAKTKHVIRVSLGLCNTGQDVDVFGKELKEILAKLK